jgi:hypothetical protein
LYICRRFDRGRGMQDEHYDFDEWWELRPDVVARLADAEQLLKARASKMHEMQTRLAEAERLLRAVISDHYKGVSVREHFAEARAFLERKP